MTRYAVTALILIGAFVVGVAFVKLLSFASGMAGLVAFALIGSFLFFRDLVTRRRRA